MVQDIVAEGTKLACEAKLRFGALSKDGLSIKYSIRIKGKCAKCNVGSRDDMKVQGAKVRGARRQSERCKL